MAEQSSNQDRSEQPTPQRLEKAHREGQVARSQELSGALILLAGTGALATAGGGAIGMHLIDVMIEQRQWMALGPLDQATAVVILRSVVQQTVTALLPFMLSLVAIALLVNLIQARGVFSMVPVTPKLSRVSPLSGFRRVFSPQAPFALVKSVAKLTFLVAVTYNVMRGAWPDIVGLSRFESGDVLLMLRKLGTKLAFVTGVTFLGIAAFDYLFQTRQHIRGLKMTKQDVLREHKETEGDPIIKSRIRALARSLSRQRMLADVAKADVVVTNPTHVAVALKYDPGVAAAPMVLAMGQRKLAERIKEAALAARVPLLENRPLAQALIATAKVGQQVPPALYTVVAEVIAFVFRQRQRRPEGLTASSGGNG